MVLINADRKKQKNLTDYNCDPYERSMLEFFMFGANLGANKRAGSERFAHTFKIRKRRICSVYWNDWLRNELDELSAMIDRLRNQINS